MIFEPLPLMNFCAELNPLSSPTGGRLNILPIVGTHVIAGLGKLYVIELYYRSLARDSTATVPEMTVLKVNDSFRASYLFSLLSLLRTILSRPVGY